MIPTWGYLAIPAGAAAIFLAIRRFMRPQIGSNLRPLDPAIIVTAEVVNAGMTENGHQLAFEYVNPAALAAGCPGCDGALAITAEEPGEARVYGDPCLTRRCEPAPSGTTEVC